MHHAAPGDWTRSWQRHYARLLHADARKLQAPDTASSVLLRRRRRCNTGGETGHGGGGVQAKYDCCGQAAPPESDARVSRPAPLLLCTEAFAAEGYGSATGRPDLSGGRYSVPGRAGCCRH